MAKRKQKEPVILPYRCPRCDQPGDGVVRKSGAKEFPCGTVIDETSRVVSVGHVCLAGTVRYVVGGQR